MLSKYNANINRTINTSRAMLERISTDIEKSMERVDTREKYLNTQLSGLLNQYSKTQEELKQVEEKYGQLSGKSISDSPISLRLQVHLHFSNSWDR